MRKTTVVGIVAILTSLALMPLTGALVTTHINQTAAYTTDGYYSGRIIVGNVSRDDTHIFHVEGASILNGTLRINGTITHGKDGESFTGTLTAPSFGANRILTYPDATGTFALVDFAQTWTGSQTFTDPVTMNGGATIRGIVIPQTFGISLTPTATGSLPSPTNGLLVFDDTTETFKVGIGDMADYHSVATLERDQSWDGFQTFNDGVESILIDLTPTETASLPAVEEGRLVYDTDTDTLKIGSTGTATYRRIPTLEGSFTWTGTQTFQPASGGTGFTAGAGNAAAIFTRDTAGATAVTLTMRNNDPTDGNRIGFGYEITTTGTGGTANTLMGRETLTIATHDHATRCANYNLALANAAAVSAVFAISCAGQVSAPVNGINGGLLIGDTQLYRDASDVLRTPDTFTVDGDLEMRRNGFDGKLTTETLTTADKTFTLPNHNGDIATVPVAGSTTQVSLTLGTFRTPSTTRPTHVEIMCDWTSSTAGQAGDLTFTIDGVTTAKTFHGQNPLAAGTWTASFGTSFILPPNAQYRPNTATGTGSFNCAALELTL